MSAGKPKRQPKARITLFVEGNQLAIKLSFIPSAKTKGPMHPAHAAALEMVSDYAQKQKSEGS